MSEAEISDKPQSKLSKKFQELKKQLCDKIIGQDKFIDSMLITLLCDSHMLVEGAPGLAKTKAIKELTKLIEGKSSRIQFTPDLLPSDITGTDIYRHEQGSFEFNQGPIFNNLILADEINRAPAKVQSALLEAMAERQITVGKKTYKLPQLFMVMATQNPIEQEGTYPLPEAQLDRFLLYTKIDQPDIESERKILKLARGEFQEENTTPSAKLISQTDLFEARVEAYKTYLSPALEEYIVQLVIATRKPGMYSDKLASWINFGASPRATIALDRASRIKAWLDGRDYVAPEDVHYIVKDVLRHRIILTFAAEAEGVTPDSFIDALLNRVPLP